VHVLIVGGKCACHLSFQSQTKPTGEWSTVVAPDNLLCITYCACEVGMERADVRDSHFTEQITRALSKFKQYMFLAVW
jgi:hypothetical protein